MGYQMFADGFMLGFLSGVIFCGVVYKLVLQRRGRSSKHEIDLLVRQFEDHFRNSRRGNGGKVQES